MLLPEDPVKRPSLWDALATQLATRAMCFVVKNGVGDPLANADEPSREVTELTLSKLRASQVCRISANRGAAISPHFAGERDNGKILITELLAQPSEGALTVSDEKLRRDLETVVINLFFADSDVRTVLVPLRLAPWNMRDADISLKEEGLEFRKKL
jgi:hypothetical protein